VSAEPQPVTSGDGVGRRQPDSQTLLGRLERDTVVVGLVVAAATFAAWPSQPQRPLGVIAGVALVAVAYAGIRAGVGTLMPAAPVLGTDSGRGGGRPDGASADRSDLAAAQPPASRGFVKFFTRHAILAAGAYVMIARFELHPVAMLAGVTTPAVAAGIEFVRIVRARGTGSHSRSS
jgi:hypothetical protein